LVVVGQPPAFAFISERARLLEAVEVVGKALVPWEIMKEAFTTADTEDTEDSQRLASSSLCKLCVLCVCGGE
jgi:hypothetical protein